MKHVHSNIHAFLGESIEILCAKNIVKFYTLQSY